MKFRTSTEKVANVVESERFKYAMYKHMLAKDGSTWATRWHYKAEDAFRADNASLGDKKAIDSAMFKSMIAIRELWREVADDAELAQRLGIKIK